MNFKDKKGKLHTFLDINDYENYIKENISDEFLTDFKSLYESELGIGDISELQSVVESLEDDITELENEVSSLEYDIEKISNELDKLIELPKEETQYMDATHKIMTQIEKLIEIKEKNNGR